MRGSWLSAAIGQRLRHSPGTTSITSGRLGTNTCQSNTRPRSGFTTSSKATASAVAIEAARSANQTHPGTLVGI
jgi:hypothetical protein